MNEVTLVEGCGLLVVGLGGMGLEGGAFVGVETH